LAPERLIQVRLSFARGSRWGTWFQVEDLNSRIVDLLGIRYIITRRPLPGTTLDTSKYLEAGVFRGTFVYENRTALPRFWLVHHVVTVGNLQQAIERIRDDFNPRVEAVVETDRASIPEVTAPPSTDERDNEAVAVRRYRRDQVEIQTHTQTSAFLVSSETFYPGWVASLDGGRTPIYVANAAFRGVWIPPGDHTVVFVFAPLIAWISALVSCASATGLVLLAVRPRLFSKLARFERESGVGAGAAS
jgi:hypothetical protein